MAIELSIQPKGAGPEAARLVPVATLDGFRKDWLPSAHALKLFWVPLFETGAPVSTDDLPSVLSELKTLEAWIKDNQPDVAARIAKRLQDLISELEALQGDETVELYIG